MSNSRYINIYSISPSLIWFKPPNPFCWISLFIPRPIGIIRIWFIFCELAFYYWPWLNYYFEIRIEHCHLDFLNSHSLYQICRYHYSSWTSGKSSNFLNGYNFICNNLLFRRYKIVDWLNHISPKFIEYSSHFLYIFWTIFVCTNRTWPRKSPDPDKLLTEIIKLSLRWIKSLLKGLRILYRLVNIFDK